MWYWHKGRHTDQGNGIESRIDHKDIVKIDFDKAIKVNQWGKDSLLINGIGTTGGPYTKILTFILTPHDVKINSRWIICLNVKKNTIKLLKILSRKCKDKPYSYLQNICKACI